LTCPLLKQAIHCRNCDVFIQAGRSLLERDLPRERRDEWAQVLTQKKEETFVGTAPVLVFRIEREWLALPVLLFEKIMDAGNFRSLLHKVPHKNNPIFMGIINVQGQIRPCVSFRNLLGLETTTRRDDERHIYQRLAVINGENGPWVFRMDEVHGIYHLYDNMLRKVPVTIEKDQTTFSRGMFKWKDLYIALLNEKLILHKLTRCIQ